MHKRARSSRKTREKRFKRLRLVITKDLRIRIQLIIKKDIEKVRIKKDVIHNLKKVENEIADKIIYVRSKQRRKALMDIYLLTKSIRHDLERSLVNKEISLLQYGIEVIKEKFTKLISYCVMAFNGLCKDEDSLTKEMARMYMTNLHPDDHHFTMNAIRLTDMTMQFLKDMKADFYVSYQADLKDMASPWSKVCNILLMLAEFLLELMRRKGRKEHVRNKSKGHYGTVKYDEPVHTVIDINRMNVDERPLNSILGNTYTLCRDKARSLGRPELANRIISVGVYVIPKRRSKLSRKRMLIENPTLSYYYRFRGFRYFKPKE